MAKANKIMRALKKLVGAPNSPVHGINTYQSDLFIGGTMEYAIMDNIPMNDIWAVPDFSFDPITGTFSLLNGVNWFAGSYVIFCYTPKCNCG